MILIAGSVLRTTFLVAFSVQAITYGTPSTQSTICQMAGFFNRVGNQICGKSLIFNSIGQYLPNIWFLYKAITNAANVIEDLSVLFLTIHGTIQIFRPTINIYDPRSGLERFRPATDIIMFLMPIISTSLAYINKGYAFTAQGAICAMPLRPL